MEIKKTNMEENLEESYREHYVKVINYLYAMAEEHNSAGKAYALKDDFNKLGLFASAAYFLGQMYRGRMLSSIPGKLQAIIKDLGIACLLSISWHCNISCDTIVSSQIDLFLVKNKRYGGSFRECYEKDGLPYAFGHLQEKINRICSLLMLNEEAGEEPVTDSLKDLLGYCVLTLIELDDGANYSQK